MPASSAGQRPEPSRSSASSSSSSATWIEVARPGGGRGREDAGEQLGADGERGVGRRDVAEARRPVRRAASARSRAASASASPVRELARSEQLVEQHARQARAADPGGGRQRVADVADRGGPERDGRGRGRRGGVALLRRAVSALRTPISVVAQANRPLPPGTASTWPDSSRWQCALTRPGQQDALRRAPRARRETRRAARRGRRPPAPRRRPRARPRPPSIGWARNRDHPARAHQRTAISRRAYATASRS